MNLSNVYTKMWALFELQPAHFLISGVSLIPHQTKLVILRRYIQLSKVRYYNALFQVFTSANTLWTVT